MKYATVLGLVMWAIGICTANAVELPAYLTGQWCQTTVTGDLGEGDYIKAKNYCKESRSVVFHIRNVGFWVKLAGVRPMVMCVPQRVEPFAQKVEPFARGWLVVADCGADDLSTGVYRHGYMFEFQTAANDKMIVTRWTP